MSYNQIHDLYVGQLVICINHENCKYKYSECKDCYECDQSNKPENCDVEYESDCEHAEPHIKEVCTDPWCSRAMTMAGCFPMWRLQEKLL